MRRWPVWALRRPALVTVLTVELVAMALVVAVATHVHPTHHDWITLAILSAASVSHMELVRGIERIREGIRVNTPYMDLKSVWTFAGVLLLPASLALALVALTCLHQRLRLIRVQTYRWLYNCSVIILSTLAASAVLETGLPDGAYPGLPGSWLGLALVILAALMRWFLNLAMVVGIMLLASPKAAPLEVFGGFDNNLVEVATLTLGALTAVVVVHAPWFLVLLLPVLLVLHRSLLLHQYEVAARTDAKTGLVNAMHWSQMARGEIARAERDETSLGVVMLDLDHFKRVNDTYGHLTGDAVLKAVADALRKECRDYDVVGRFGGEEFMILIPGVDPADLTAVAERFRMRVSGLVVASPDTHEPVRVTASAGMVAFPGGGQDLDELLLAADAALYRAKEGGRDQTCLAPMGGALGHPKPRLPKARQPEE